MKKKRVVVKIGSSSLTNELGAIDEKKMNDHILALARLRAANHDVVLVSSGAVASGFGRLGYSSRPVTVKGKQASAAVGQSLLIQSYIDKFDVFNIMPAQLLLTRADFLDKKRYHNAFQTLTELLERGLLPIINENDTIAIDELTFGDNDMLSALVAGLLHADQLIILTDINGLYDKNPHEYDDAKRIDHLTHVTDKMVEQTDSTGSSVGTGGMKSKLEAAETALTLGVPVFIGAGKGEEKLLEVLKGNGDGTYIDNESLEAINTRRQWIALHSEAEAKIYIDEGAEKAILTGGGSLLPAGVLKVDGRFKANDVVEVYGPKGKIGKGEVSYSSQELEQAMTDHLEEKDRGEMTQSIEIIHRNRWIET